MSPTVEHPAPFTSGWFLFDLGTHRPCESTYCLFPYESLPPIAALDGSFDWLRPVDSPQRVDDTMRGELAKVERECARLGLTLPETYRRFMGSRTLQAAIPDITGCWFTWPDGIVPCAGSEEGYIIRFLNDQQDCLLWFLYLTPQGDELVLCRGDNLDGFQFELDGWHDGEGPTPEERKTLIANTIVCAPSFEAFIYRFWLESSLWVKLNGKVDQPLTNEERRYLAYYDQYGDYTPLP